MTPHPAQHLPLLRDALRAGNLRVLATFLGPAYRGLVQRRGRRGEAILPVACDASFDWTYLREEPALARLYEAAKDSQWNGATGLEWALEVDPHDPERPLLPDSLMPMAERPEYQRLTALQKAEQRRLTLSWFLSQFLHGEQGALYAAAQVTQAVPWLDAKLYGSTQVVDEGRHVEVFHRYLTQKLEKLYVVNDNLYVVIDALMSDGRWDLKFLGMQILIEGLALGAFGFLRAATREPLLKAMLTAVITDEARHVHYGVVALEKVYKDQLSDRERRDREDWAFEVAYMLRNRFLAIEFYEEHWAHAMSRRQWEEGILRSEMMQQFRRTMFKRIIPNLKRLGLLSDRVRARYEELGLLQYESGRAAPELTAQDLLEDRG